MTFNAGKYGKDKGSYSQSKYDILVAQDNLLSRFQVHVLRKCHKKAIFLPFEAIFLLYLFNLTFLNGPKCYICITYIYYESHTCIYFVNLGNGRWHISGFHSSLNSSIKEDIKIQSGCFSWDSIVLVNHEGEILLKEFNKGDSSWHKIKLSKENRASVDLDDAQCIQHAVSGGKHVFAITGMQPVYQIDIDIHILIKLFQ